MSGATAHRPDSCDQHLVRKREVRFFAEFPVTGKERPSAFKFKAVNRATAAPGAEQAIPVVHKTRRFSRLCGAGARSGMDVLLRGLAERLGRKALRGVLI